MTGARKVGVIYLHLWQEWARPDSRTSRALDWGPGMTLVELMGGPELAQMGPGDLTVHVNGRGVLGPYAAVPLQPGDHVDVARRPAEPATVTAIIWSLVISAAISFVIQLILPKPKGPKERGDDRSGNYGWSGKENSRTQGAPRSVVYGEMRIAPQIIDEYVTTRPSPPSAVMNVLLGIGEGPVHSIGGIEVDNTEALSTADPALPIPTGIEFNSNPAENFRDVQAHVRMGTNEQAGIPGFEAIHTVSTVGVDLLQDVTPSASNEGTAWDIPTLGHNSNTADVQTNWDAYAAGFDLPEDSDRMVVRVQLPAGLYRLDTSGNLRDAYFAALIRTRQLDGGGSPILIGGDNGDGWVYAPPPDTLVARQTGSFDHEIAVDLFSPAGWVAVVKGRALWAGGASDYAYTAWAADGAAVNSSSPWAPNSEPAEFSFEGWVRFGQLGNGVERGIFGWSSTGAPWKGCAISTRTAGHWDSGTMTTSYTSHLAFGIGHATGVTWITESQVTGTPWVAGHVGLTGLQIARWYHVAVTYKRAALADGRHRARLYLEGSLVKTQYVAAAQPLIAPTAPFNLGRVVMDATLLGKIRMDEVRIYSRERTATEISSSYNTRIGRFGSPSEVGLVCGWHFDLLDAPTPYTNAYSNSFGPYPNPVSRAGSAIMGDSTALGVVYTGGSGTRTRARYRVQVLRHNLVSTSTMTGNDTTWASVDGILDDQLAYPNSALVGLKLTAAEQLSDTQPRTTLVCKGRLCPVWDGVDPDMPSVVYQWTANPAWVVLDILTNRRYGRGGDFGFDRVDLRSFKEWADYCDARIYDSRGLQAVRSGAGTEPIVDLLYDSTLHSGWGGLVVYMRQYAALPLLWRAGYHVGFEGLPFGGPVVVNINTTNIASFEISDVTFDGGTQQWRVTLRYDTATYGDPWTDGAFLSVIMNPTVVTGSALGLEERFRFDGVMDTFERVWDTLLAVCATARAVPMLDGRKIRVRVARPRPPVGLVGMGSIEPGSFKVVYNARAERPNTYIADFLDRDRNWARNTVERRDSNINSGTPEGGYNRENLSLFGVTRYTHVVRDLDFRLRVNSLLKRQGEFTTGIEGLTYEPGDVLVLSHDLVPWGVSGRLGAAPVGAAIVLERAVTLQGGSTYYARVRINAQGQTGSGSAVSDYMETREITSGAGTYAAGATLTLASAFTVTPAKDDPWLVYRAEEQLLVEIAEITLTADYRRRVRWVEYRDDIYDVEPTTAQPPLSMAVVDDGRDPPFAHERLPGPVSDLTLREFQRRTSGGPWESDIAASWVLDPDTAQAVDRVVVFARSTGEDASWEEVVVARGPASAARFRAPMDTIGPLEVAVQPVSRSGARYSPDLCARASVTLGVEVVAPPAPTDLTATMDGEQVTYRWAPPADARGLRFELRRGGWSLGQVIGTAPEGTAALGPVRNWANGKDNLAGDGPVRVYVRARDERGAYSEAVVLEGFNPVVPRSVVLVPPNVLGKRIFGDEAWDDYGEGWQAAAPVYGAEESDPVLTDVEIWVDEAGRKVLRFAGSALTGSYTAALALIDSDSRPETAYVEAYVEALQVPPVTLADMAEGLDSPRVSQRSLEGALAGARCGMTIEWRTRQTPGGAWSAWAEYTPGPYTLVQVQFRLTLTRPDTDWQVRVLRFGTRISRPPRIRGQRVSLHQDIAPIPAPMGA